MNEFVEYLHDLFERFGPVTIRKMFGGYGLYHDGLMFGLVSGDRLYLKADAENVQYFEREGLGRFEYQKGNKRMTMSYYQAPAEMMEERELASQWARRSFEAALRAQASKPKTRS
ncbi:MAG: TfoX/Sxy family protein [Methylococcaceae bacterium]|nr:TfoX/Sxy family protein [Methylococcaceae bacterium]